MNVIDDYDYGYTETLNDVSEDDGVVETVNKWLDDFGWV